MIDTEIETYLKALVIEAYPVVRESQIYFNYPQSDFEQGIGLSGRPSRVLGSESLTVQMHVDEKVKLDRELLIQTFTQNGSPILDEKQTIMRFLKTIQKDFIKVTELQGAVFVFNFRYEIN